MIEKNYISEIIDGKFSDARAKIINAGLKEFAKNSFGAVRTREIAALAGGKPCRYKLLFRRQERTLQGNCQAGCGFYRSVFDSLF